MGNLHIVLGDQLTHSISCLQEIQKDDDACPFNYLYWDFMLRHQAKLSKNPRLKFAYANLAKMPKEQIEAVQQQSRIFRSTLS